jgi:hypothetical protein
MKTGSRKVTGKLPRGVITRGEDAPVNAKGPITEIQRGVINGLGRDWGFTAKSLDEWTLKEYGARVDNLTRADAARAIGAMRRGAVNGR